MAWPFELCIYPNAARLRCMFCMCPGLSCKGEVE